MAEPLLENNEILISNVLMMNQTYLIKSQKVMPDSDLANLKQDVSRNVDRFPEDSMFQLSSKE